MSLTGPTRWRTNPTYPHSFEQILDDIRARLDRELDTIYNELASELKASPRQAYEKAFLYWKKAVARLVAEILARYHRRVAELVAGDRRYSMLVDIVEGMIGDRRIIVTTSTASRLLYLLKQMCREIPCSEAENRAIEALEDARGTVYRLHNAFYEGAEYAGFYSEGEAVLAAHSITDKIRRALKGIA